ncbi:MAG: AMMECR1 domain-containing protein [Candidatus Nealsonbacteria bacterium CG23_combo_of_CG06-09_8_20_14_all_40_13]|uniref:AMMECR1 domain-containing protein n=1 Tax=Candidatus Nealsonbacteria bacterium CG23_combo_of_CG06-09_8_20_14_all_40_13 TaxID=1974724 RepID=A0A2G9YR55_9BACT|nr:MAG: AMMECR1 domain-containing protein [Candidatus Nealsonbacteria bacterium CG23_combo_of_CG06-09_8_20_14_all_40_13]PIR70998.1 MAG: AMMECR1 domain-containing protein [Candidatus Nealsonbacteria bacterium CG10_big_fil_rev_8_21_14_0_10_40_24]PIU43091.1 MAG: AMMECR1 domain-containing protein [Candidatus Nealsonbacteria bacterium CG07_land_8_20_14_0_80_40_10]
MNPYVDLAQKTIQTFLGGGREISPPKGLPKEMLTKKAGVFVSLHHKKDHSLRGCIGSYFCRHENIAQEIIKNAISAAVSDPRFSPLSLEELPAIEISVDVLSQPEPIEGPKSLDPKKYGVIVKTKDGRTGLLLPDILGISDAGYQVAIARRKAGILPFENIYLYRFTVERYK